MPEDVDPARVFALGNGLHDGDGVSLIPMAAKLDLRKGSDAAMLIFRRGSIDAALMDANPKLKLIQRIGARADAIDLAAAKQRGILVSCVPRATLAAHRRARDPDGARARQAADRGRRRGAQGPLGPRPRPAGSQRRLQLGRHPPISAGCSARPSASSGSARSARSRPAWRAASARACSIATATGCPPRRRQSSASNTRRSAACSRNPISSRCTRPTSRRTAA